MRIRLFDEYFCSCHMVNFIFPVFVLSYRKINRILTNTFPPLLVRRLFAVNSWFRKLAPISKKPIDVDRVQSSLVEVGYFTFASVEFIRFLLYFEWPMSASESDPKSITHLNRGSGRTKSFRSRFRSTLYSYRAIIFQFIHTRIKSRKRRSDGESTDEEGAISWRIKGKFR